MKTKAICLIAVALLASPLVAADALIAYDRSGSWPDSIGGVGVLGSSPSGLYEVLTLEGFNVDTVCMKSGVSTRRWRSPVGYDVACYFILNNIEPEDREELRDWIKTGHRLISLSDWSAFPANYHWNEFLSEPVWSSQLGSPRFYHSSVTLPAERVSTLEDGMFINNDFFHCIDSLCNGGPHSGVEFEDSSTCDSCCVLVRLDTTYCSGPDPHPALATYSKYEFGGVVLVGDIFIIEKYLPSWSFIDSVGVPQFVRDLFRISPPLENAWLDVARSQVILSLEGDTTGIVWDSIYVTFNEDSFYTHDLGWDYYPSGIDFNAVGDTGYSWVCVIRVPGPTGESILPCGPICDSLWLEPAGIAETPTPQAFTISAHPNPFNSAVTIAIDGVGADLASARIEIYDVNGRRIAQLPVGEGLCALPFPDASPFGSTHRCSPTDKAIVWHPDESLPSGVYLVRANFTVEKGFDKLSHRVEQTATKRIVYLK